MPKKFAEYPEDFFAPPLNSEFDYQTAVK